MSFQGNDDSIGEYIDESEEIFTRVGLKLKELEAAESVDHAAVDELYRDIHTVKGTSQLFGFQNIGNVSHIIESMLSPIREGQTQLVSQQTIDLFYEATGFCEKLLVQVKQQGSDASSDVDLFAATLIERFEKIIQGSDELVEELQFSADVEQIEQLKRELSIMQESKKDVPVEVPQEPEKKVSEAPAKPAEKTVNQTQSSSPEAAASAVRVNVDVLDKLMNLVGELVLVRNQVLEFNGKNDSLELSNLGQDLDVVTSDLQEEVMKTRMQPIGIVLKKFQRVVHDIAKDLDKEIELELEGVDTEVDRTLLDAIKDPLTHIVRNSCDHGIESTEERNRAGKKAKGRVKIHAFHEGGQVVVQITDNGKGISREKVIEKALEREIITKSQSETMSDKEVYNLIFAAGFSTAEKVSAVSGRGVGMDVVKTNIERVGGSVDIGSVPGQQTQISMRIPLTLAIIPALTVKSQKYIFAIPQVKLEELVRIDQQETGHEGIEMLQGKPIYRLRGNLLPLVSLNEILGLCEKTDFLEQGVVNVVVLRSESSLFGLIVDEILDNSDIVVKPNSPFLKPIPIYSGSTILGDGKVALILDVAGVAKLSSMGEGGQSQSLENTGESQLNPRVGADVTEYLLVNLGPSGTFAIPLCLVNRLEEFPAKRIEYSGDIPVIQYRDKLLPIISLNKCLGLPEEVSPSTADVISVVVILYQGEIYGLQVDQILDVVQTSDQANDLVQDREGILGNVVVEDEVVTIVDVLGLIARELDRINVYKAKEVREEQEKKLEAKNKTILLVEDTSFFRRQIRQYLDSEGYQVIEAEDGAEGFSLLQENSDKIDLILSDIEMPKMTGLDLARAVRAEEKFNHLPMIAVTTKFSERDVEIGKTAGFDLYLGKLNREELTGAINQIFSGGKK